MESILADPRITVVCVTRMIGLAVFVTTAERLCHYRDYAIGGILSPATRRFREKRFGSLVDAVFGFPGFPLLMLSRALAGLGLTILADKHDIAGCCLLVIVLFCLLRDLRDGARDAWANTTLRQARSLFSPKKILPFLPADIALPSPLPFDGVELFVLGGRGHPVM